MQNESKNLVKKKSSTIKYILSFLFLAVLVVITFVVICTKYDIKKLKEVLLSVDYSYILISLFLLFIYILFESCSTKTILSSLGVKSGLFHNIEYSCIDYYFCAITPSAAGGQPMVLYYMAKDNISIPNGSITLLINTALFKIILMFLTIISLFFVSNIVIESTLLIILLIIGFIINLAVVIVCFLGSFKTKWIERIGKKLILWLNSLKIIKRPLKSCRSFTFKMKEYKRGAELIKKNKAKFALALFFNLIQRVAMFSIAFFVYLAFCKVYPSIKGYNYWDLFAVQVIISMSVDSLPFPGGMGISELLYVRIFETIYITESCVASAMLLTRAISFYIPLIITALIVIIKHIRIILKDRRKLEEKNI